MEKSLKYLERYVFSPLVFVALGGMASVLLLVLRARMIQVLGCLPECMRWLAIDFGSDAPQAPRAQFSREVTAQEWDAAELAPGELCLLSFGGLEREIAQKMRSKDPSWTWLEGVLAADVLDEYTGAEGSQIPMLVRGALAACADDPELSGGISWVDMLSAALADVAPNGKAMHDLTTKRDLPDGSVLRAKPTIVIIVGGEGGTGSGALLPVSIAGRWLATKRGIEAAIHGLVLAGHYRPQDGQEDRKSALNYALDKDVEYAMERSRDALSFRLGADVAAEQVGPLFDEVHRLEATGRLQHDEKAVLESAAEMLLYFYTTAAGWSIRKSRANNLMRPAMLRLENERSWD